MSNLVCFKLSYETFKNKIFMLGAREMTQGLKALVAFVEGQVQFPILTWWLRTTGNSSSRRSMISSGLREHCMHVVTIYTFRLNTYIIKKCIFKKNDA